MDSRDRALLLGFVDQTHDDLVFVLEVAASFVHPAVAERLWPAWQALEDRDEFGQLRRAVELQDYDVQLDRVGLSGPELEFKLAGVDSARGAGRENPTPRRLKKWLRWIDVLLGSLLAAVGAGEAIKELKEGIEAELEPGDEPESG
jgi:hypothetical protein